MSLKRAPITLVLFDAFDTLVTPRIPPHMQYAEESRKAGLDVSDESMQVAFKKTFKEMTRNHPIYGLNTGLSSPNQWWIELIELSLLSAGISSDAIKRAMPSLGPSLLSRFSTKEAYNLAEGVPSIFESLFNLQQDQKKARGSEVPSPLLRWNLATNSDARILSACKDLGLDQFLDLRMRGQRGLEDFQPPQEGIHHDDLEPDKKRCIASEPSLSYFLGHEKPDPSFFKAAVQRAFSSSSSTSSLADLCAQCLYVGDHFREDYMGARQAGLQAVWLQRSQPWPSDVSEAEKGNIDALHSMEEVANIIRDSW